MIEFRALRLVDRHRERGRDRRVRTDRQGFEISPARDDEHRVRAVGIAGVELRPTPGHR